MRAVFIILGIIVVVFMALPIFVVLPMSLSTSSSLEFPPPGYGFGHYVQFFRDATWTGPLINSFIIAAGTTVMTMMLITPAAFALVRHEFRGRAFVNMLLLTPVIVPHIVMAVGYFNYFANLGLLQTYFGVMLAHTCLTSPLAFLTVSAGLKGFDRNYERAAQSLGAPPLVAFFIVTFPILRAAFLVSALLAFVHSFDETTVALFISGRDVATLPKRMFDAIRLEADPVISVASALLFGVVFVVFVASLLRQYLFRRPTG